MRYMTFVLAMLAAVCFVGSGCGIGGPDHIKDGANPDQADCSNDAISVQSAELRDIEGLKFGRLLLRRSDDCAGYWAKVDPYLDEPQPGVVIHLSVVRKSDGKRYSLTAPDNGNSQFTQAVAFGKGCAYAEGHITINAVTEGPVVQTDCK